MTMQVYLTSSVFLWWPNIRVVEWPVAKWLHFLKRWPDFEVADLRSNQIYDSLKGKGEIDA